MPDRYPGYNVLAKRHTPSWNEQTRRVIDRRLAVPRTPRFFSDHEFATLEAIAAQVVPQPAHRPPIPVAGLIDAKLLDDIQDSGPPGSVDCTRWMRKHRRRMGQHFAR
jgi:hypothetical protein